MSELLKKRKNIEINIEPIYQYLVSFKGLKFLFKNQSTLTLENLFIELSKIIELKRIHKNELIFQQGDVAQNFYIILKGDVKILKLKPYEYYMTNEEYISFLLNLRLNNQIEIIHQSKRYNNLIYPIPENFDLFIKNLSKKNAGGIYIDMKNLITKAKYVDNYIQKEEKMNQKNKVKLTAEEYIKKFSMSEEIIHNTEIINDFIDEKNTYDSDDEIDNIKLLMKDRKKVIIPNYVEIIELSSGNTLEEFAFESHINLYQSSAIALDEDVYLGYINKKKYYNLIHEAVSKRNKKIFSLLVYFSFLKQTNLFLFEKKYLGFINDKVFEANYELIKEGEESEYTYFISEGEFEVSVNKNIIEINEMIINYKKILKSFNDTNKNVDKHIFNYDEEERQNKDIILNKKYRSNDVNEILMKKRYIKLNILHKRDILGLSDAYIFEPSESEFKKEFLIYSVIKRKCLVSCKCINSNSHSFYMPNSIFNNLYYYERNYNTLSKNMECKKICSIIERLQAFKKSVFDIINQNKNKFSHNIKIFKDMSKFLKFNKNSSYNPKLFKNIILELKDSKDQCGKNNERNQRQILSLKKYNNMKIFKSNNDLNNKEETFPSIINEHSKKSFSKIKKKKKINKIFNLANFQSSDNIHLRKTIIHNFVYENLFYNYTFKNNIKENTRNNKREFADSLSKTENQRYSQTLSNEKYKTIKIGAKNNYMSLKRTTTLNESDKYLIKKNKNKINLIGSYDLLAFEKFKKLFSSNFSRTINDSKTNKSKTDF